MIAFHSFSTHGNALPRKWKHFSRLGSFWSSEKKIWLQKRRSVLKCNERLNKKHLHVFITPTHLVLIIKKTSCEIRYSENGTYIFANFLSRFLTGTSVHHWREEVSMIWNFKENPTFPICNTCRMPIYMIYTSTLRFYIE